MQSRRRPLRHLVRPQAQEVADRVDEVRPVHGVEMELGDAAVDEVDDLLGRDRGGDKPPRLDIRIEPLEALRQPARYAQRV